MFYIRRSAAEFWDIETTRYHINENLYEKEGKIHQTNFEKTLIDPKFKQKALQSFKDEYMMDFVNVATCRTSKELPARLREALPDMEDLKKLM